MSCSTNQPPIAHFESGETLRDDKYTEITTGFRRKKGAIDTPFFYRYRGNKHVGR